MTGYSINLIVGVFYSAHFEITAIDRLRNPDITLTNAKIILFLFQTVWMPQLVQHFILDSALMF